MFPYFSHPRRAERGRDRRDPPDARRLVALQCPDLGAASYPRSSAFIRAHPRSSAAILRGMRLLRPTPIALFWLTLAVSLRAQAPAALPADLDAYVARAMQTFEVPGLALSVVKDGRVVKAPDCR